MEREGLVWIRFLGASSPAAPSTSMPLAPSLSLRPFCLLRLRPRFRPSRVACADRARSTCAQYAAGQQTYATSATKIQRNSENKPPLLLLKSYSMKQRNTDVSNV